MKDKYTDLPPLFVKRYDFRPAVPMWQGQTAYILGGGSSFDPAQAEKLRGKNVIGCNEAFQLGADVVPWCHFLDLAWWMEHKAAAKDYTGTFTTCATLVEDPAVRVFKTRNKGIEFEQADTLGSNRNTGLSAINLAIHFGATRIILIGFDMGGGEKGGHWYAREKPTNKSSLRMHRKSALEVYEDIEEHGGIEILNASPDSKLTYWPKITIEEALA